MNVSNLAPPEGTRVTSVVPESPPGRTAYVHRPTMRRAGSKCRPWPTASGNSSSTPNLRNVSPPVATYQAPPVDLQISGYSEFPPAYADTPDPAAIPHGQAAAIGGCHLVTHPIVVVQSPFRHARPIKGGVKHADTATDAAFRGRLPT